MANKNNPFSSYYNYPKVWGEAEPQKRWHSDKSEKGIIPPWLKTGSNDHEILWSIFVGEPRGKEYEAFVNAGISEKEQMLKNKASDTDDALWRSKEWMRISGNPEAEEDYIPSALEYANPFTKDLPQGETMMPEDFR